ncbi:MAG: nucleoside-diphosphate sugar epimerase/dehydratase [Clostridium sp.]|nr:nucleoside-diphosphate sugar epimerase/dehydratase [Clostridium sp.]MDU1978905.1 nucleoside-diphosphate sugar epimerase/dehydratase [Clostridium sp.]MDU1994335.1 nucleoside-diphosphate sugar epimerase/dehydratase [Clostridium sp.]MDU4143088.1 nucleoside-diphosphate sugar epimerase/dehydratase [Clostridium sp.]MDU6048914.1 nucleoside-diphosphate sugar epimerase/dehydratase [Clostridium sp.]MDU6223031.1 nucleoside-diphosphate sugar epimerase/dehydratase [Clostridium sp.]
MQNKKAKMLTLVIVDLLLIFCSYFVAFIFRFKYTDISIAEIVVMYESYISKIFLMSLIFIGIFMAFKQYKSIWSIASIDEFLRGIIATGLATSVVLVISCLDKRRIPLMVTIMAGIMIMVFCNGIRIGWRVVRRTLIFITDRSNGNCKRVLVVGAGGAGALVANEYKKNPQYKKKVVAFVDDFSEKRGTYVSGVKVLGNRYDIPTVVESQRIEEIIIAISELKEVELKKILDECKKTTAQVKIMPGVSEVIDGNFSVKKIRDVDVEDLLGREPIKLDFSGISSYIENKVIMVTGGGGSIGSELCRQIARFNPKELIIFDIYENNAYDLQNELLRKYKDLNLKTLIGSVRDRKRLNNIFKEYRPQVVFHAAAHKHVPLMEDSPGEAIKNNVLGTLNAAELASEYGVERFVLISTDKAVNPTNVMGATKRMCEMVIQSIDKESDTEFVAVRFGNVLGSNGSVVPLFKKQIAEGGPVTLTHKDITRYFMTIPEASQLVLQAGAYAKGGEIFVLDMGQPVKIYDLAENLIRLSGYIPNEEIEIKVTGLRPGEKLYEELLMDEEGLSETPHKKIFIGRPGEFKLEKVKNNINELLDVVKLGNNEKLREKLQEVVPTYKNPKQDNEVAATKEA